MLELRHTPALNHFKDLIGQTNHYLITILIGLDGVLSGAVTKGESFNVTWQPKSIEDTAKRSRRFARNSALSWAIDSLDAYIGFLGKKPFCISDTIFLKEIEKRSVYIKFSAAIKCLNFQTDFPISLIHLGIQWRNNLVHYHAENELDQEYATFLRNTEKKDIQERFRGLDSSLMLNNFNNNCSPTLKEVAAIIQSINFVVVEMDKELVKSFSATAYCERIIRENMQELTKSLKVNSDLYERKLTRYFLSKGFTKIENGQLNQKNIISIEELKKLHKTYCDKAPQS